MKPVGILAAVGAILLAYSLMEMLNRREQSRHLAAKRQLGFRPTSDHPDIARLERQQWEEKLEQERKEIHKDDGLHTMLFLAGIVCLIAVPICWFKMRPSEAARVSKDHPSQRSRQHNPTRRAASQARRSDD